MENTISDILKKLPEKRLNSRRFNEVFRIDGIPVWYFMEPFINSSFLSKPFKPRWEIIQEIKRDKSPSLLDKSRFKLFAFVVKKGLTINEKIKYLISKSGKKDSGEIEKKDALFIASTDQIFEKNGKLEFLEFGKIVNYLKIGKKVRPLVLACDPFSKNSFFKLNRYGPLLYDYITPEILRESKQSSCDLHKKWKILDEEQKIKLFIYQGRSYWKFFENDMNFLFSKELLFTFIKYYLTFKEILKKHDIKVVYLTSFVGLYELSALGAVYKLNRKVVHSSHGYTRGGVMGTWEFVKNILFAAGGEEHRRDLLKRGIKKESIAVTGFPFLDEIVYHRRGRARRTKKTVTLLTTRLVESKLMGKEEYFKLIRETLVQIRNVKEVGKIIIKLHPREEYKSEYESIARSLGLRNVEVIQEPGKISLYSVINDSDLLIGFGSTAVLEGLMFGKDAIHLEMLETRPIFEFKKATFCVKKVDEITEAVRKVLTDKRVKKRLRIQRERYLRQAFYAIDGKAHERVADLITHIVKETPPQSFPRN